MDIYIVRPGDSLREIARQYGVSVEELARKNQLDGVSRLIPNMALVVPGRERPCRPEILVGGCAYPNTPDTVLRETLPYLSFLCPFSSRLTPDGSLIPLRDTRLVRAAMESGAAPFLTVTNLGDNGGFSSDTAHALFTDQAAQEAAFASLLAALDEGGFAGVNFHMQYVYPFDREGYSRFVRRAAELLHARGYYLCTTLAPRESAGQEGLLYSAHDYAAHASFADWVILMTCEWGYTYSAPQAVSPVNRIRRVLDYALTAIPASKLVMTLSNYGYRWRLPWRQGDAAAVIGNAAAMAMAISVRAELKYDSNAEAPFFTYTDAVGQRSVVFFEDARSVRARLALVAEYALAGLAWWTVSPFYRPALLLQQERFSALRW